MRAERHADAALVGAAHQDQRQARRILVDGGVEIADRAQLTVACAHQHVARVHPGPGGRTVCSSAPRTSSPAIGSSPTSARRAAVTCAGARVNPSAMLKAFAVRDMNLITGQQQYSGRKVAELVIDSLGG